jgi:hypothetical protein
MRILVLMSTEADWLWEAPALGQLLALPQHDTVTMFWWYIFGLKDTLFSAPAAWHPQRRKADLSS